MTAAATMAPARAWPQLSPDECKAGSRALLDAADGDPALVAVAVGAAPALVLDGDAWHLAVAGPRYADMAAVPRVDRLGASHGPDAREDLFCEPDSRLYALGEGLKLLADPTGPAAELDRRRRGLADRRQREADAKAERERAARENADAHQRWLMENAEALNRWRALPHLSRALIRASVDHPQDLAAALGQVARLVAQERLVIDPPDAFLAHKGVSWP